MTEKLYYRDSYIRTFDASLITNGKTDKGWRVVLDRTAFYPEGGGQPADRGLLAGITVLDVQSEDEGIAHYLETPLTASTVIHGELDWDHRFHAMQQHTGQHILSAAYFKTGGQRTVSVHLGQSFTTIEFEAAALSADEILAGETLANTTINRNLAVIVAWPSVEELGQYNLRRPCTKREHIRLIGIEQFDWVACGGVHCASTGEVGLVKAVDVEKIRGHVRVTFKIGDDAYRDYRAKHDLVSGLRKLMNAGDDDIQNRIGQLGEELVQLKRERSQTEKQFARTIAGLLSSRRPQGPAGQPGVISHRFDEENDRVFKEIAKELIGGEPLICCLVNRRPDRFDWIVCCGETLDLPFQGFIQELLARTGSRGGGRHPLWQGIGPDRTAADFFIETFRDLVGNTGR